MVMPVDKRHAKEPHGIRVIRTESILRVFAQIPAKFLNPWIVDGFVSTGNRTYGDGHIGCRLAT
jgi:hypothetical protein